jgi:DNA-binding Xre family transcriptional regulator
MNEDLIVRKMPSKKFEGEIIAEVKEKLIFSNIAEDIGWRLKILMKQGGWTNKSLARVSGLSDTTIRRILTFTQDITVEALHKICLALDITLDQFWNINVGWHQPEED